MMAIMKARIAAAIIYETIDQSQQAATDKGEEMLTCNGRLEFKDVHFRYPTRETPILKGLSWHAEPGETIAFVGKSGCGKSTSIGLLTRLYDCDKGVMTLDGRNIRALKLSHLRKLIGIVQQEPCLFNGTIRENIVLGRNISDEKAEEAARIANAHDFIMKLEKGYDTIIGTGGIALSGGQKQRLAIARAVAGEPKILLLDEATSALDSESEKIVQLALNRASVGRTTIVIAHRLSTLKDVQRIYAIEDGRVVQVGTHFELLSADGLYSNLARAQEVGLGLG
ncbi:ABC transporter, ATP-binding protein, partial [Oesophagostomum dentatum]